LRKKCNKMSKKQRIIPIAEKIEINTEAFAAGNLPDLDAVNQTVAYVTGKPIQTTATVIDVVTPQLMQYQQPEAPPRQIGRPKKEIADGRIKYNTMIKPEWIRKLRIRAAEQDISPADLLERIFQETILLK
jgi:hypothetical protein